MTNPKSIKLDPNPSSPSTTAMAAAGDAFPKTPARRSARVLTRSPTTVPPILPADSLKHSRRPSIPHAPSSTTPLRHKSNKRVKLNNASPRAPIEPSLLQAESDLSSDIIQSRQHTAPPSTCLPLEIALLIIDHTTDEKQLKQWLLVNKTCNLVANRKLWGSVKLDLMKGNLPRAQRQLDRLLEDDGRRIQYVRRLCVQGHIWRDSARDIVNIIKKVNKVFERGMNIERIFLHLIYFQGDYESCKADLRPLLTSKSSKLRSLTIVTNPDRLDQIECTPKADLNLHLALYQTNEAQVLPSRFLKPEIASHFRLTSLDIQNISNQSDDVIKGLLENHRGTLRHLAASSYTASRDAILLMGFPVLQSFLFHTFHCARHNTDRAAAVHSFLTSFFTQQTTLRSINIHVKNKDTPLSYIFPVRLPGLLHLAIRHFTITVDDLVELAARQPELETLAVGIILPSVDPLDNRMHTSRRKTHKIDYVARNPTIIRVITTQLPKLRFLTMDAYDKGSSSYIIDFFRDIKTFKNVCRSAPKSFRLFAARYKDGTSTTGQHGGQQDESKFRTLRVTEGKVEELESAVMKTEMRGCGRVGLGDAVERETRREEKMGVVDLMWRDLYGMPLWVM